VWVRIATYMSDSKGLLVMLEMLGSSRAAQLTKIVLLRMIHVGHTSTALFLIAASTQTPIPHCNPLSYPLLHPPLYPLCDPLSYPLLHPPT